MFDFLQIKNLIKKGNKFLPIWLIDAIITIRDKRISPVNKQIFIILISYRQKKGIAFVAIPFFSGLIFLRFHFNRFSTTGNFCINIISRSTII